MNYLITGSTGFIGKKILEEIKNSQENITLVLRKNSNRKLDFFSHNIKIIYVDNLFAEDVFWWRKTLEKIDCVIHSAWYVKHGEYLNSDENFYCLKGTLVMLQAMKELRIRFFVGLGSCYEYDFNYSDKPFKTKTPLKAKSPYTLAKISLYNSLKILEKTNNFKFAWCRIFYLYGEGEDKRRLIPYIHEMLKNSKKVKINNGELIRDYIDVKIAAKLISKIALERIPGEFNICSGEGKLIKDIAIGIAEKYNKTDLIELISEERVNNIPKKIIGEPSFKNIL
nr:NAD(P)-dependent oxidoreductase [Prochlorococcus marinus]